MSTLPRPTGKELVRALERAGLLAELTKSSHWHWGRLSPIRESRQAMAFILRNWLLPEEKRRGYNEA